MSKRYESVAGVRNLYIDHGREGSPFTLRYKKDGKTHEVVLGVMSRKDAITRRDEFFATPVAKTVIGPPKKCEAAFEEWFAARTSKLHKRPFAVATAKRYRGLWDNHAKEVLGRMRIRDVEVEHIAAVFTRMQEKGLDPNNAYVMLSAFFKAMTLPPYQHRLDNPVSRLGELKPQAPSSDAVSEEAVITSEELEQIILGVPSKTPRDMRVRQTMIRFAYLTGLRLSEILGLTWDEVDLNEGEVSVTKQLALDFKAGDPETWFGVVKGNKAKVGSTARIVPLSDEAWSLMREHREWAFGAGLYRGPESIVFPTKNNTPIDQAGASEMFGRSVKGSGLTRYPFTFHCLRHSFASQEFALGTPIEEVARLLGHSSDVTKKRYVHLVDRAAYNAEYRRRRRAASN